MRFIVFVMAMCFSASAYAQLDPLLAMSKCQIFSEFALVSRALAVEGVPDSQADRVLGRIYILGPEATKDTAREMIAVVDAARNSKQLPGDFADTFAARCMKSGGDVYSAVGMTDI